MAKAGKGKNSESLIDRIPFYYGWVMVPVAVIAQSMTGVGQTYGVSVFNPSFRSSLQISLSQLTGAYMFGTLLAALPQPYIGSLMDRFGIRRTMTWVVILLGLACLFISRVQGLVSLLLGFFLLRLLGQGALSLLSGNIPPMWFRKKLGTVTGLISSGRSASMAVVPPVFLALISRFGWRSAYVLLGVLVWVIMLPLLGLLFRNNPGEIGQTMDGVPDNEVERAALNDDLDRSLNLKEARRTPAYWIATLSAALWSMIVTAIFFNLLPIFNSQGLSDGAAAATYTTYAAASIAAQLIAGPLADKSRLQYLLAGCMGLMAVSVGVLSIANSTWLAHTYAGLLGISTGLIAVLDGTLWPRYYGRKHLGKIRGSVITVQVAGSSVGPFITGVLFDWSGSYQTSFWVFLGLLLPASVAAFWAVNPRADQESLSSPVS
ncbi:MAG: MFS transporter [Anaerolineales bacterium]|nr:MFS transporter [Anaerolineales bacterium]